MGALAVSEAPASRRRPFLFGLLLGIVTGISLGSALAAIFGDDVSVLVRRLIRRIRGQREEPNYEILLQ